VTEADSITDTRQMLPPKRPSTRADQLAQRVPGHDPTHDWRRGPSGCALGCVTEGRLIAGTGNGASTGLRGERHHASPGKAQ
jgi:hypothetical protein